ncbi:aminoglycoside phosphotransferase (APT) family kinase protein [Novosphingobium kunmingense]|uniref:Aminoglycoside phosphotransferase (APT) family kinase protein n=1 Tax=Novosphingobium kunmingense TaxID=1211806 RepID=A0A2N0H637_9SPHN|nr:phosphotransferase family protein [Novosphingobium kunmingense]PKB14382.1 aminoglycoside phosphotransferase (APT) family kinase protein [Novosphingobium kunmingense]
MSAALADPERLARWLDTQIPDLGDGPLRIAQLHGGTSNVILTLNRGGSDMVLRRPPAVPPPGSEKGVLREARVLTALNGTPVPHPHCHGVCDDPDVIGAPFYVMERVEGWAAELRDERIHHRAPFDRAPCEYGIAYAMVDGLVALANVDYRAVGLEGFGKPDNFLERQVDRWESQIRSYPRLYGSQWRDLAGFDYARDWLRANVPDDFRAGVIHGDVGTPNALFAFDRPARLTALIDWELSTIGDPLIDLAWFTGRLRDEDRPGEIGEATLYNVANFPTRQELARYYAAGTGRDLARFDYYCVLAAYKSGCILEYKVAQSAAGILPRETGLFFDKLVRAAFARAESLARKAG